MTRRLPLITTGFVFSLMAVAMSISSVMRHHVFMSSFDFAIFAQAIWNTWHGSFLYSSIKGGICLLGDHVSPILVLFAPFFAVTKDPSFLLILQAAAASSSVFPLYLVGREVFKDARLPLVFVLNYALYLPLRNAIRFDFHPELFADPLVLWAFYFILKNKLARAGFCLAAALTTKEIACGPVAMLGLWSWWFRKKRTFGISVFLIAAVVFILNVQIIAPHFRHDDYFYLGGNYLAWFQKGGNAFFAHIFQSSTAIYLKKIFLPVAFLSFLSPSVLVLTFPILFQNLAAQNLLPRSTFFQYTTLLTPFVFVSAIYGFRNVRQWIACQRMLPRFLLHGGFMCAVAAFGIFSSGKPEWVTIAKFKARDNPHYEYVRRYLDAFPNDVSLRTHELFAPHAAARKELYIYENEHPKEGGSPKALNADYVIIDDGFLSGPPERHHEKLLAMGYRVAHQHDGLYVYAKNGVSEKLPNPNP